jgi:hypothetical protein
MNQRRTTYARTRSGQGKEFLRRFSSRPCLLFGSIMIRPLANSSTASGSRKGTFKDEETEFCEKAHFRARLCAAGHTYPGAWAPSPRDQKAPERVPS